ncbi:hypothetical protein MNEG_2889 [Monoraphidium neglectum]|jgi:hypothetical protein|uniref:Uncharacterized protein n=1 Tax=Monoraphidium neglectum TaxID=145388 RepID=A0A0D2K3N0_9CHLO|nr:hypothetical protein MNEG_2889 [Monoraphidium neglectum]KIZ05068.1 hypothetical protein MNEG_2889 [Monoraphidium neglectum]|eukprot:XP_013904087.1 hypothetical protein MNEG_2889 [Monoraphidium neglectum]
MEALAGEAQKLPNWQPEALVQVQQAQQQLQQQLGQVQQQLGQLQQQVEAADHNSFSRLWNFHINIDQEVMWLRNSSGQAPQQAPLLLSDVREAAEDTLDTLLAHYGLYSQGTVSQRRRRLLVHLGIFT